MESNHLLEVKFRHMGCIIGIVAWNELDHFGETVLYHHNGVFVVLGAGKNKYKIHVHI